MVAPKYKETEAGVIPEDWKALPVGRHVSIRSGESPSRFSFGAGKIPYFKVEQVGQGEGWLGPQDTPYFIDIPDPVDSGSLVFPKRGASILLNRVRLLETPSFMDTNVMSLTTDDSVDPEYLHAALLRFGLFRVADTTSIPQINNKHIHPLHLPFPPTLDEQRAIAGALSDVDELIESLEKLIAKKRAIKTGTMQQLLTPPGQPGHKRLPGFSGEWEVKRLGDIGAFSKGSGVRKDEAASGDIPCVRYGEIYTVHNDHIRTFCSRISLAVAATATPIRCGDILFAGSGETKEEIGKCVAFLHNLDAYAGGDIVIMRPHDVDSLFLGYYLNTSRVNRQKASKGQGDAVVHISSAALASIPISLPDIREQTAIATILSDMDTEIEALEARLVKTRAIKQGMMQELLTGRVRLVDTGGAAG